MVNNEGIVERHHHNTITNTSLENHPYWVLDSKIDFRVLGKIYPLGLFSACVIFPLYGR